MKVIILLIITSIIAVGIYFVINRKKHITPTPPPPPTPSPPPPIICTTFELNIDFHGFTGLMYTYNKETNVLGPENSTLFAQSDLMFLEPAYSVANPFSETFTFLPTNQAQSCILVGAKALISKSILQDIFTYYISKVGGLNPGNGFYTLKGNIPIVVVPQPIVPSGYQCSVNVLVNNQPSGMKMDMYHVPDQKIFQIGGYDSPSYWIAKVNIKMSNSDSPSTMNSLFNFGGCPDDQSTVAYMITKSSLQQLLSFFKTWKSSTGAGFYDATTNQPIAIL